MMARPQYEGIKYPDRAEDLSRFSGYRVFLDHWQDLSQNLNEFYENIANRGVTRALTVYGPQGTGKTLFANQLEQTFGATKSTPPHLAQYDPQSLWHRIAGGKAKDINLVMDATRETELIKIENDADWVQKLVSWHGARKDRICIAIADNAERGYFRQGISGLDLHQFLQIQSSPGFMRIIAQQFVDLCRTKIPNTLFVILSNDNDFLDLFKEEVDRQHKNLVGHCPLPIPTSSDKEKVVRVNTNRLNKISYWYCLDKAGTSGKKSVREALLGASNFPEAFSAIDQAVKNPAPTRIGRPGRRNLLSLIALYDGSQYPTFYGNIGEIEHTEFASKWGASFKYRDGWAAKLLADPREASLLESEWQLRVVFLGSPFVSSLLAKDDLASTRYCRMLLERLKEVYGPGTQHATRKKVQDDAHELIDGWPEASTDLSSFWDKGQTRSNDYEPKLRFILDDYNKGSPGFLNYRPDCTISPFRPCSILSSQSDDERDINEAIRRDCHVFEFSAFKDITELGVISYLSKKARNYLEITQEQ